MRDRVFFGLESFGLARRAVELDVEAVDAARAFPAAGLLVGAGAHSAGLPELRVDRGALELELPPGVDAGGDEDDEAGDPERVEEGRSCQIE